MLDELLDVFERDRRPDERKPRRGLRGLISRLVNDDRDGHDRDRHRDHDDEGHDRRDHRYDDDRRKRERFDFDD